MNFNINLPIDKASDIPLYIQLYEKLKAYILDGTLVNNYKLPTIRALSKKLSVNNITVINAYRLLEEEKLIYKKKGSGTYVMPYEAKASIICDFLSDFEYEDILTEEEVILSEDIIDFSTASPDPELFPVVDFQNAVFEVLKKDGGRAFMYNDSKGYMPLRASIKTQVESYGISADIDDIYIISGAQQGIDIISKALLSNGDYVFVENPTYSGALSSFLSRGANIIQIPLLDDGMDMKELEYRLNLIRPKFIYVMPNFQNPTGYSYSKRKMKHILLLCKKYDVLIVEDDYLSDLNYSDTPQNTLKSYDVENRVVYIKSFSKIFMPGLRLAYLIIPDAIKKSIAKAKYLTDISTSGFMQRVLDFYLRKNIWDKHIDNMKREYGIRYLEAVRSVKKYLRGATFYKPNGGMNLWVKLPPDVSSEELCRRCRNKKVRITPGTVFLSKEEGEKYIRISFSAVKSDAIIKGIEIIGRELEEIR